jgi:hypothetical protein
MATKKWLKEHRRTCIDCKTSVAYRSIRCYSCDNKNKYKLGLKISWDGKFQKIITKELLIDLYTNQKKNIIEISKIFNCGKSTICNYLKKYNIKTVKWTRNSWIKSMTGINNPNYINGEGNFPYPLEFNDELKEQIRKRDNYICQNCGMTEEEHLIVKGQILSIHHIDYNKDNCKETNLITVCDSCNTRANFNRDYWLDFYSNKLMGVKNAK